jgi:hypothetical protein
LSFSDDLAGKTFDLKEPFRVVPPLADPGPAPTGQ